MNEPEINSAGTKYWKNIEGQLHRENGPAIEYAGGTKSWYLEDKKLTEEEFKHRNINKVPTMGFFVSTQGDIYLNGIKVDTNSKGQHTRKHKEGKTRPTYSGPFKASNRARDSDMRKFPGREAQVDWDEVNKMAKKFESAAKGLASAWAWAYDMTFQNGKPTPEQNEPVIADARHFVAAELDELFQVRKVALTQTNMVVKSDKSDKSDIGLLKVQADSIQQQMTVLQSVDIENSFETEKLDSFKAKTRDAIQEAGAILDDMEDADALIQARAIKGLCLEENKRRKVMTHQRIKDRLVKLQKTHKEIKAIQGKNKSSGIGVLIAIIFCIFVLLPLALLL